MDKNQNKKYLFYKIQPNKNLYLILRKMLKSRQIKYFFNFKIFKILSVICCLLML